MEVRKAIEISGIVQGVGFRPYVFRLARERGLAGYIENTAAGVAVEVQGEEEQVASFLAALPQQAPPLARISEIRVRDRPCNGDRAFSILPSRSGGQHQALIAPDVAICNDCLRELLDPADRRHLYPFINCTNCGPRFTIVRSIPYDRARTSMAVFPMCHACQDEYDDPASRRFHAQPNACWACGPRAELWDTDGRPLSVADPVAAAAARLRAGDIVAVKGLGGFHLACDAASGTAVEELRRRKGRDEKPFAVMFASLAEVERCCMVVPEARTLLLDPARPIVLLPARADNGIAAAVAPGLSTLGAFLPYAPLHHVLFAAGAPPALVMTSGNRSEEPIARENREAVYRLSELADVLLVHNREILLRADDSIVRPLPGRPGVAVLLRRSRGFAPAPVELAAELPPVLAVGGELKNTICLARGRQAFLSQHIGDLENVETLHFFEELVEKLEKLFDIRPEIFAHDLHPDYLSTQWVMRQAGKPRIAVQHHHAHIASCMAENRLDGPVIGVALDGTGYGADGAIWGGEVLLADFSGFRRAAHLSYVPMPGGAAAIREPWRMAVSYLLHQFGPEFLALDIPFVRNLDRRKAALLVRMIGQGVNSPLTSSCGRLFDAVAALVGIRQQVSYEAQAAIELEQLLDGTAAAAGYPLDVVQDGPGWVLDTRPMFESLLDDLRCGVAARRISRRFHDGLVEAFVRAVLLVRERTGVRRVCLSGGSFQNLYLLTQMEKRLADEAFEVYTHAQVPAGDGGLCLGQALVAARAVAHRRRSAVDFPLEKTSAHF